MASMTDVSGLSITMAEVRRSWGDMQTIVDKIRLKRLDWLGHLARMVDNRMSKGVLFSWLSEPLPRYGPSKW